MQHENILERENISKINVISIIRNNFGLMIFVQSAG